MAYTISIAMATYNGERYIREQLDSILAQTVAFDELIICDDVSTDRTWDIISEYAAKDTRIKLHRNSKNIGFLRNFEQALRLCNSDFIALSDQDDVWLPQHIEHLINAIGDKMLTAGDAKIIDSNGNDTGRTLSYCSDLDYISDDDIEKAYFILFYQNPYQGASMLLRRSFLEKALPIPEAVNYHDVWFSILACLYGGFNFVNTPITMYRRHDEAITGKKRRQPKIKTFIGHIFFNFYLNNRFEVSSEIRERIKGIASERQIAFLNEADRYFERRKTFFGRIINIFFELKHYKLIYGCK